MPAITETEHTETDQPDSVETEMPETDADQGEDDTAEPIDLVGALLAA
ncbi:hypothetical protein [Streptomyces platensis]|nr:hypothetical protein [Streptomyces platensis]MCF3146512.1 hypothetical protein [Streptomyces platensis]